MKISRLILFILLIVHSTGALAQASATALENGVKNPPNSAEPVNAYEVTTLWMPPFQVDITDYVKKGNNSLRLEVTNTWTNRLIGDECYPRTDGYSISDKTMPKWYTDNKPMPKGKRITFTTYPFYKASDPLMKSGLLGPVTIKVKKIVPLK